MGALALLEHAYTHHPPPRVRGGNAGAVEDPRGWAAGLRGDATKLTAALKDACLDYHPEKHGAASDAAWCDIAGEISKALLHWLTHEVRPAALRPSASTSPTSPMQRLAQRSAAQRSDLAIVVLPR